MKLSWSNTKVLCNCSNPHCRICKQKIQINPKENNKTKGNIYSDERIYYMIEACY